VASPPDLRVHPVAEVVQIRIYDFGEILPKFSKYHLFFAEVRKFSISIKNFQLNSSFTPKLHQNTLKWPSISYSLIKAHNFFKVI
jgi:hypothetical protein